MLKFRARRLFSKKQIGWTLCGACVLLAPHAAADQPVTAPSATLDHGLGANTVLFCCWNEFGEGHFIEPTRGSGFASLDAIRDTFCEGPTEHTDIIPQDVGLQPAESWYLAARGDGLPAKNTTSWNGATIGQWSGSAGFTTCEVRDGVICGVTDSSDPTTTSPELSLRASHYRRMTVEMRIDKPAGGAQLFWSTPSSGACEAASVSVPVIGDGQWHAYLFDLAANPNWGGCIVGFRFDPVSEPGVTVEIRSIRLE